MSGFINNLISGININLFHIPDIKINDIIDICLVSFFIYQILFWIKETRAWSLFKGIAVIALISLGALVFRLFTITWIISVAFNVGLISVIILFQPELRKALEQIGKSKIKVIPFTGIEVDRHEIHESTLNEIIKAITEMSASKTGALILVERDVALGDHERTGIPIDAVVSSQLLINIFEDKTPLHDGAVIIRNNRIKAASCILPLTQAEIAEGLGTRHRAAVGASEVSDAVSLVVSEETGVISAAVGGKLHRGLNGGDIQRLLISGEIKDKKHFTFKRGGKKGPVS